MLNAIKESEDKKRDLFCIGCGSCYMSVIMLTLAIWFTARAAMLNGQSEVIVAATVCYFMTLHYFCSCLAPHSEVISMIEKEQTEL